MAIGVRPNIDLARTADLDVNRGILVGDDMGTSDSDIYAVGECIEHNGQVFGLVAPIWDQAKVCGARLAGDSAAVYVPPPVFTSLKITGIDVFSAGALAAADDADQEITLHDAKRGLYKKVILRDDRIVGSVLYGSVADGPWYVQLMRDKVDVSSFRDQIVFGRAFAEQAATPRHAAAATAVAGEPIAESAVASSVIRTTCPYCGVGCGLRVAVDGSVTGDPDHPANAGRLCSKGAALGDTLTTDGRLLYPQLGGRNASWDEALDRVAAAFTQTIAEHGPDSVALYVSGQFLTEDYYVANKLMKGFIGSANIDTNSRLCMASSVAGHIRAFGEDIVPGCYDDIEAADLVVLVGSNTAWCHPVLYQRLVAARDARGTKVVAIDPRHTPTCDIADIHLAIRPGTDVAVYAGLLVQLIADGVCDPAWTRDRTSGFAATAEVARQSAPSLADVAEIADVPAADLARFYDWFAATERTVTFYSQGTNQSSSGTDKVNAIINCHLATGRIGRPGMGPFSLTGQPNAMGGREVGGLANQLAAHMTFADPAAIDRVRRFWQTPRMAMRPGLKAVELFEAALDGKVKALWILNTNPAVSMPRADRVRAALGACPFVVVSDCWPTDTTCFADIVLPAAAWGEKDGTVTNSERCISRQRAVRPPPGDARPDWWMLMEVARRMGWQSAFAYRGPAEIFREHAALSGFENESPSRRLFDIGALSALSDDDYDRLPPIRWPLPHDTVQPWSGAKRLFGDGGPFPTSDGRARFVPTPYRPPAVPTDDQWPLLLNTGRLRDQWHTMTRTGRLPRLMAHQREPVLDTHPADAARLALIDGGLARVESPHGASCAAGALVKRPAQGRGFRGVSLDRPLHLRRTD